MQSIKFNTIEYTIPAMYMTRFGRAETRYRAWRRIVADMGLGRDTNNIEGVKSG